MDANELASQVAHKMLASEGTGPAWGIVLEEAREDYARISMVVRPDMLNGHGIAHGGFIFLLADSAFAFACNSHNEKTVAAQCNISFILPGKLGDQLIATAREISRTGRSGIYDVRVTVDGVAIAELRGHSRTLGGAWVPAATTDAKTK